MKHRPSSNNNNVDTIVAIATPPGRGGIGIIRISGPRVEMVSQALLGTALKPRVATYRNFLDSDGVTALDTGVALFFPGPASFTGENVLELQGHGGPVVLDMLLKRICALGIRLARPGEFTERAFLNNKIDLVQAEAIADLIDSTSQQAARSALSSLSGAFSREVKAIIEKLITLRLYIESDMDFSEEDIAGLSPQQVDQKIEQIQQQLKQVFATAEQGCVLREGITLVIAGRPNVGKSSLLNLLAQHDRAIVSDIPGTTRDTLKEQIQIDGLPVHIVDTAGLRESTEHVERIGMERTWQEIEQADRVLLLIEDEKGLTAYEKGILADIPAHIPVTLIRNKCDLSGKTPGITQQQDMDVIVLSIKARSGLDALYAHIKQCAGYQDIEKGQFLARRRHLDALERAQEALQQGKQAYIQHQQLELLAEDLRQVQQVLGEICGEFGVEDLLSRIFSEFCLGK